MKKIIITLALSMALAACASNKDPVNGPLAKALAAEAAAKKAAKQGDDGNATPAPAATCPTINGKYVMDVAGAPGVEMDVVTKVDGVKFAYAFDADGTNFIAADGVAREMTDANGKKSTSKVTCNDATSISIENQAAGEALVTEKITKVSETELNREVPSAPAATGLYKKQ